MDIKDLRNKRLADVNSLIAFIVETDKERHNPTFGTKLDSGELVASHFLFDGKSGLLYFVDSYTKKRMRPINHLSWSGFSEGGTMRHVSQQLADFIMTGKQGFLNDYKEIWGWEFEKTMLVRTKALEIGFIDTINYPHKRWE